MIGRIGVVGLGKMGGPIAGHMAKAKFQVSGYDVDEAARRTSQKQGVMLCDSPAAVAARSELVVVLVAFEKQVEDVLFSKTGVVAEARPGTIVAVGSTIAPSAMQSIARRLEASGLVPLDIPICRGEAAAQMGNLLITGGGDAEAFARCRPIFETFADSIHRLGAVGTGQVGKMINNLILWACISVNAEGTKLGARYGIDAELLKRMLLDSSAQNWAMSNIDDQLPLPWAEKDMMIVLDEADRQRVSLPLSGVVKEVVKGIKIERGDR